MNKIILCGNVGKQPEIKQTNNGKSVISFSLAVKRKYQKDITEWFNCVAWNKTAELIGQYVNKGDKLLLTGEMQSREYQDNQGNNKRVYEVVVSDIEFLTPKQSNTPPQTGNPPQGNYNNQSQQGSSDFQDLNDDSEIIPF